jgi:hypothetical protein
MSDPSSRKRPSPPPRRPGRSPVPDLIYAEERERRAGEVRAGEDIAVTTLNLVPAPGPERCGREFRVLDALAGPASGAAG